MCREVNNSLKCIDIRGNEADFIVTMDKKNDYSIKFYVTSKPIDQPGPRCYIDLTFTCDNIYKVTMIECDKELRKKGIPDKALPWISEYLKETITSSSRISKYQNTIGENRYEDAEPMWERIVVNGDAIFDQEKDIFIIVYEE